jgi:aspartate/methionine/tyrosine aminotransferase
MKEPWSKRHKREFKGCQFSLSNSFAQPLSHPELVQFNQGNEELLELYQKHNLEYVPNGGSLDLRQDIATVYYHDNNQISAQHILVFPGGQVALQTAALVFARNCHSIVFTPGYQSTVESPEWAMGHTRSSVTQIPRSPETNWQVDPKLLRAAIQDDTRFLILNEPYNPGGIVMTKELQQEVIDICRQHDIVILCDEVYRLLEHDQESSTTTTTTTTTRLPTIANAYENGISAVTMSKPWGGCGITIGWLACSNLEMIQQLIDVQYFGTACVSRASEIQGRMVLAASNAILEDRLGIIRLNKQVLQEFIQVKYHEWFSWNRPNAGAIAFVKFLGPWTSEQLGNKLAKAGISIKPAYCFAETVTPEIQQYFRLGFGERKMPLALEALGKFVDAHEKSWREVMIKQET